MNYSEAIKYIESVSWKGSVPGLERIGELCERLGHPERKTKFIHVAGTNGKGSVSAMISSVLTAAGYKTGLFTSPHLIDYTERFAVNGKNITKKDFCAAAQAVKRASRGMDDLPTEFEILTAMAFVYFETAECDVAVLECGMGGRLDATNVIPSPAASVITNIALDHTSVLGNTEVEIAGEKAGIVKRAPLVVGKTSADVEKYLKGVCIKQDVSFVSYSDVGVHDERITHNGLYFNYDGTKMRVPLCGEYQKINLKTALAAIEVVRDNGFDITNKNVSDGLSSVRWIGRFETLCKEPLVIFDGAHNPDGASFTTETFKELYPNRKAILISGVMSDKNYETIARILAPVASFAYTVAPDNSRALSPDKLSEVYRSVGVESEPCTTVEEAVRLACGAAAAENCPVLCVGSLYMYGDIVSSLKSIAK